MLLSDCLIKLNRKDFLNPLLEITVGDLKPDIQGVNAELIQEACLKICEGIIRAEDIYRTTTLNKHLGDLSKAQGLTLEQLARV